MDLDSCVRQIEDIIVHFSFFNHLRNFAIVAWECSARSGQVRSSELQLYFFERIHNFPTLALLFLLERQNAKDLDSLCTTPDTDSRWHASVEACRYMSTVREYFGGPFFSC